MSKNYTAVEQEELDRIDALINEFDVAMLVTATAEGELRARPMAVAGHESGSVLHFLTRSGDEKLEEVLQTRRVNVCMQSAETYLSVSGVARISTNLNAIAEKWSATARVWFPAGQEDPELTLVSVEPTYAEAWDSSGARTFEHLWEASKALLSGEAPSGESAAEHLKVKLD